MTDMTVTVVGLRSLAENACRWVFGDDANQGPLRAAPAPLLSLLGDWPAASDAILRVGLQLPIAFDIEHDMARDNVKSAVLVVNRVLVLHEGAKVGYALRTNQAGLNAIDLWTAEWARFHGKLN